MVQLGTQAFLAIPLDMLTVTLLASIVAGIMIAVAILVATAIAVAATTNVLTVC